MLSPNPSDHYDVVIVGGRVAGASTAMLLARAGVSVLVVDRDERGSDTFSTHALMRGAVTQLERWGIAPALRESTPAIESVVFRYGDTTIPIDTTKGGKTPLMAPRRTVLDGLIVDAAEAAGVEFLHRTRLTGVFGHDGRITGVNLTLPGDRRRLVTCDLLVGADGRRSTVARMVGATVTHQGRHAASYVVARFRDHGLGDDAYHWLYGEGIGGGVIPTNDGEVVTFSSTTPERFRREIKGDLAAGFHRIMRELDPDMADALDTAVPLAPYRGSVGVPGRFHQAHGPGWALVGDAGYWKDPYAAHGITDALRDAELLARAIVADDLAGYETVRDELSRPLFDVLEQVASYDWDLETLPLLHLEMGRAMSDEVTAMVERFDGPSGVGLAA